MKSNKTFHRLLSVLLLVCMLMSLMPATAFAEEAAEAEETALAETLETEAVEEAVEPEAVLPEEPAEVPEAEAELEALSAEEAPAEPAEAAGEEPAEAAEEEIAEEAEAITEPEPADEAFEQPAEPAEDPAEPEEPEDPKEPEEPADTTWTMALPFTPGTLTGSGASFANLTLDFSPADPSIGRTIDAYWIGVAFIAPEAVTAENVGKTTFSMDGGSSWQSFDAAKDGQNADGQNGKDHYDREKIDNKFFHFVFSFHKGLSILYHYS